MVVDVFCYLLSWALSLVWCVGGGVRRCGNGDGLCWWDLLVGRGGNDDDDHYHQSQ